MGEQTVGRWIDHLEKVAQMTILASILAFGVGVFCRHIVDKPSPAPESSLCRCGIDCPCCDDDEFKKRK